MPAEVEPVEPFEPILEVRDLVKHFPLTRGIVVKQRIGEVKAVDGVSFELGKGATLGLVGESGCGKTTLAKLLMAAERPTSGTVLFEGRDIFRLRRAELRRLRRRVQMVLQDPYTSLNPRMTVGDIVGEPFAIHRDVAPRGGRRAKVRELLEVVGLDPDHERRYPHQFSGGQRQRIGIARALALRPDVIICDEPVSALDVSVQAQILNLLEDMKERYGLTLIFIAHDLAVVKNVSDRVVVMYLGKICEVAEPDTLYANPAHPYTKILLASIPEPDPLLPITDDRISGELPSPMAPPSGCRFRTRCPRVQDVCAQVEPEIRQVSPGHYVACHFPLESAVTLTGNGHA